MTFEECCQECLRNDELVNQFCRLKNIKRPDRLAPIEMIIDQSCGYNSKYKFIREFTDFVFVYIWIPTVDRELSS